MIGERPRTGVELESPAAAPTGPLPEVATRLWRSVPALLGANLVFLAWCAPFGLLALLGLPTLALAIAPLTVGPALVALVTAAARVIQDEPVGTWAAGLRDVRAGFGAGAALTSAVLVAWHAQLLALRVVVDHGAAPGAVLLWGAQIAVLVLGLPVGIHALALVGLRGQGVLEATRNGFVVSVRHPATTVAMLALVGAGALLTWTLAGAPLIIVPGALAFLLVSTTQRLVEDGRDTS